MPHWLIKLFLRPKTALRPRHDDHDPEWAEFNLPTSGDLQALFSMRVEHDRHAQSRGGT